MNIFYRYINFQMICIVIIVLVRYKNMIRRIIITILNIIVLPVYAAFSVNPVNLPVSNLDNGIYSVEFDALTTKHSIEYCLDITIDQDFYYEIILNGGITWGRNINPAAIENAALIDDGGQNSNTATFYVKNDSEPMLLGTCLNLDTEVVVNVPPAPLNTKFTITATIKDPISGVNLNTPQTKNLIILTTSCDNITEISQAECEALVELYNNTYGNNWIDSDNWNLTNSPCSWNGISCINEHVIAIERQAKNLTGSLPDLSTLTELQILDLKGNKLSGYIPSMNSLTKLQILILSGGNQIIGRIPKLDTLLDLQWIDLADNQLTGNIPDLENLNSLRHLNLANNKLEGSIPISLKNLNNLELLKLNNNRINANIPDLSNLIKLQTIWLQNNQLEANIPPIDSLINLTDLDLGYNKLTADVTSQAFITSKDSDWADTQTIFPTNIIATAKSATSIEINWTAINYIADTGFYQINYSTTSGNYNTAINTNSKTDTSITINNLSPATTYYFTITTITKPHGQQQNELDSTSEEFTVTTLAETTNIVPKITVVDIDANTIADGDRIILKNIILNSEFSKTFTIINNSDVSVNLSQLEITGDDIFKIKKYFEPVIVTIEKNESTTFTISLDTSKTGIFTGEILFHFSHEDNPYNFFITSEIIDEVNTTLPNIFSTPEPDSLLDMGSSELGTPSTTTEITILQSEIEITDIAITADKINDFTVNNELNILTVQCIPSEIGTREGILKISYLIAEQLETAKYFLTCTGKSTLNYTSNPEPNSTLTMSSIIATPTTTSIEISNTSDTTLAITEIIVTNNEIFQIDNTPFLVNDQAYPLKIQCIPVQEGKYSATLTLIANLPKPITYQLECIGIRNSIEPIYDSIPKPDTTLQIGNTTLDEAITKSIMISNQGDGTLTIETSIITGDTSFSIINGAAPTVITNTTHNLEIQCLPKRTGKHTAVLTLTIANQKPVSYTLECVGIAKQIVIYSSKPKPNSTIKIGNTTVKTPIITTINIAEMGNKTLNVISNNIDSSTKEVFDIIDGMAPFSIPDGGSEHLLVVQCTPVGIGEYTAQLTLQTNDPIRNLVKYDLTCTGIEGFSVAGEIRVKSGISGTDISIDSPEIFSLIGWIKPSPEHIGQLVD
ncbi:MAG TPA: choice-of-anchor D domain-containing protein, partial [Thioploca sp.]|nr:choice-of-anchor D domain-containing protein [Thioploca sp.]